MIARFQKAKRKVYRVGSWVQVSRLYFSTAHRGEVGRVLEVTPKIVRVIFIDGAKAIFDRDERGAADLMHTRKPADA